MEEWNVILSEAIFAYNPSVHSSTGFTAYFLIFGGEARIPSEILVSLPEMERKPTAYALQRYHNLA